MPDTILITRPKAQSLALAGRLEKTAPGRFRCLIAPLTEILDVPAEPDLNDAGSLVFTSANAVESFARRWPGTRLPTWCVGPATAAAAARAKLPVTAVATDGASLLATLAVQAPPPGVILHPRGRHAAVEIAAELRKTGLQARDVVIYDQQAIPLSAEATSALTAGQVAVVLLLSRRAAAIFSRIAARHKFDLGKTTALCISRAVADAVGGTGFRDVQSSPGPDAGAMTDALIRLTRPVSGR